MAGSEAWLYNPDPEPRAYRVVRPHRPAGALLAAAGVQGSDTLDLAVPPGGTAFVQLRYADGHELPRRTGGGCLALDNAAASAGVS